MDFREFYHNNCCLDAANCGCKIILSRHPKHESIKIDNFKWIDFCEKHKPKNTEKCEIFNIPFNKFG